MENACGRAPTTHFAKNPACAVDGSIRLVNSPRPRSRRMVPPHPTSTAEYFSTYSSPLQP